MLIPTLETLKRNINRKQEDLRLFEFGKAYGQEKEMPIEIEYLLLTMTGHQQPAHWQGGGAKAIDFFSLKAIVHSLLLRLGIKNYDVNDFTDHKGLSWGLQYSMGDLVFARFGKVDQGLSTQFDLKQEVYLAEFPFEPSVFQNAFHMEISSLWIFIYNLFN